MDRKSRFLAVLLALLVIANIVVACGGGDVPASQQPQATRTRHELPAAQRTRAAVPRHAFSSRFSSLRKRQSVPWAMIFCGVLWIIPASRRRKA